MPPAQKQALDETPGWQWDVGRRGADALKRWQQAFRLLERYVEREGHARVPVPHQEDGFALGDWVSNERAYYRTGRLSDERAKRLQRLPGWTWDAFTAGWEEGFQRLRDYLAREGTTRVPAVYRDGDYPLGQWISVQRKTFKEGNLSRERQQRLESLADWTWDVRDHGWAVGLAKLEQFAAREGHARIPAAHIEDGFRLGQWVASRRADRDKLSRERQAVLEALPGWTWNTKEAKWQEAYARLQTYAQREGHARVPTTFTEDGLQLGQWVSIQRAAYRNGKMSLVRQKQLDSVPGWTWSVFQRQ